MGNYAVSAAAAVIATAEAAGVRFTWGPAGAVRLRAAAPPPPEVLTSLRQHREAVAAILAGRARTAFLLRAAEDAHAALAGPEIGPVLEMGHLDHDAAERVALAAFYAEPGAMQPGPTYCFPCGKLVLPSDRTWSDARGWCCPACRSQWSLSR